MGAPAEAAQTAAAAKQQAHEAQCLYEVAWQTATAYTPLQTPAGPSPTAIGLGRRVQHGRPSTSLNVVPAVAQGAAGIWARLAAHTETPSPASLGPVMGALAAHAGAQVPAGPLRVFLAACPEVGGAAGASRATDLLVQVIQAALSGGLGLGKAGASSAAAPGPAVQLLTRGAQPGSHPGGAAGMAPVLHTAGGSMAAALGMASAALLRVAAAESPAVLWRSADVGLACPAAVVPQAAAGGDVYGRSLQAWPITRCLRSCYILILSPIFLKERTKIVTGVALTCLPIALF